MAKEPKKKEEENTKTHPSGTAQKGTGGVTPPNPDPPGT